MTSPTSRDVDPESEGPLEPGPGTHVHGVDHRADISVRDNTRARRYEAVMGRDPGEIVGLLTYERHRRRIDFVHTVTDPVHRDEGVASVLIRTALAESRAAGLRIVVICPFLESWLQRHPDQAEGVELE